MFYLLVTPPSPHLPVPPSLQTNNKGMNFLAGFLIITFAESIVSERDGMAAAATASASASDGDIRFSGAHSSLVKQSGIDGDQAGGGRGSGGAGGSSSNNSSSGKGSSFTRGVELTAEEVKVVETECVQVLLGLISLQGGVLSRDLCGLHAVSKGEGQG